VRRDGSLANAAIVVLAAALAACRADTDSLPPDVGVVERVVDGDTVDLRVGGRDERVRLIGIDTPELHTDSGVPECFAVEAMGFTAGELPIGEEVRLERDIVGRDDYGRLLAYVFRRADGVLINELVVARGFARPLTIAPNDSFSRRFVAAAVAAETADLGLWGACR
jgi:micrococcal nuclease